MTPTERQGALPQPRRKPRKDPAPAPAAAPPRRTSARPEGEVGRGTIGESADQLARLLDVVAASDSVELKVTVPEQEQRSTIEALGMDPLQAQIRQIFFLDTPELALNRHGLVVRLRRTVKGDDSVVKLRPVDPSSLPLDVRTLRRFAVEVDALPGGYVCSATLKSKRGAIDVRQAVFGGRALHKLFDRQQRDFFVDHAPDSVGLDGLVPLGPITVLKLPFSPAGYDRRLVAEAWLYPDGSRVLELSTRCLPDECLQVAVETRAYLTAHGVTLSGAQQTKTARALEIFARALATTSSRSAREPVRPRRG